MYIINEKPLTTREDFPLKIIEDNLYLPPIDKNNYFKWVHKYHSLSYITFREVFHLQPIEKIINFLIKHQSLYMMKSSLNSAQQ